MGWFKSRRKVHVYQHPDGRWSASTSESQAATWKTADSPEEAVEALRLHLLSREIKRGRDIEVDW